jgi:hypothetical protein
MKGDFIMLSTIKSNGSKLLIDTIDLKLMLGCGRATAVSIGLAAKARVKINRRILWNVDLVRNYINQIAE